MKFNMLSLSEAFESMDKEFSNGFDTKNKLSEFRNNFVDKNSLSIHTKNALKTIIKDWYIECFPDDELGVELYDNFTFEDLVDDLDNNVFDYGCCADDSVVRERVFQELANILKVDYDVIYYRWINTDDKPVMKEGLKETWSHPWDGLKGQEKLDAIKKFCAENPSLDPARVLCSDDGLARVEEEPIIIGDYKFVQDGRAWDVYRNDEFLYTGTRAAVCRQISDLWEKGESEKVNEKMNKIFGKFQKADKKINEQNEGKGFFAKFISENNIDKEALQQAIKNSLLKKTDKVKEFELTSNKKDDKDGSIYIDGNIKLNDDKEIKIQLFVPEDASYIFVNHINTYGFVFNIDYGENCDEVALILIKLIEEQEKPHPKF